ncbi:MAG: hypothetical protein AAGA30_12325 [Planctomycetota bacterium]
MIQSDQNFVPRAAQFLSVRFSLGQLFWTITAIAFFLSTIRWVPALSINYSVMAMCWVCGMGSTRLGRVMLVLCAILVPVEVACSHLAFHTIGKMTSGMLYLLVFCNAILLLFYPWLRQTAVIIVILLALYVIPKHAFLGVRWALVHAESENIIQFVNQQRAETGAFPKDLGEYEFRYWDTQRHICYRYNKLRSKPESMRVSYHVGSSNTSHWSENGGRWFYYSD